MEMMRAFTEDPDAPGITDLYKPCDNADFMNALGLLNKDNEIDREEADVREAVNQVTSFIDANEQTPQENLMKVCCFSIRIFVGTFSALQLLTTICASMDKIPKK